MPWSDAALYTSGVALSIAISSLNSLGMGLQKRAHLATGGGDAAALGGGASAGPYWRQRGWLLGLVCLGAAALCSLGNYALLGQSRASAMAALTIVTNLLMAHFMLHEPLSWWDGAAGAIISAGIVVSVVCGSAGGGPASYSSLDEVVAVLQREAVYGVSGGALLFVGLCELTVRRLAASGAGRSHAQRKVECILRGVMAGAFSGATGFFAKGFIVSAQAMASDGGAGDLASPYFYLFALGLPGSIFMQLRSLSGALRAFGALEIVPIYQCCIVTFGVMFGWVYWQENAELPAVNEGLFALGCLISISGVLVLSLKGGALARGGNADSDRSSLLAVGAKAGPAAAGEEEERGSGGRARGDSLSTGVEIMGLLDGAEAARAYYFMRGGATAGSAARSGMSALSYAAVLDASAVGQTRRGPALSM